MSQDQSDYFSSPVHLDIKREELPSLSDLKALLEEKGKKALVIYAWRHSLRLLPFLMLSNRFSHKNDGGIVSDLIKILRANVILQNSWELDTRKGLWRFVNEVKKTSSNFTESFLVLPSYTAIHTAVFIDNYFERNTTPETRTREESLYFVNSYLACSARVAKLFNKDINQVRSALNAALIGDFQSLMHEEVPDTLLIKPLWKKEHGLNEMVGELKIWFLHTLDSLNIGFIGEDLQKLWCLQEIDEARLARYSDLEVGEDIWGNAKALEQFIVYGEKSENNAVRVMLVGPGGAGKTSLRDLILQRKTNPIKHATKGVEHHNHKPVDLSLHEPALQNLSDNVRRKTKELELFLWDFGGQSIFHNLHRGFIRRENCVYVLVVDSRHEQAPDEWLAQIRMVVNDLASNQVLNESPPSSISQQFSHSNVPVIVVTNRYENIDRKQNQARLLREYSDLLSPNNFFEFPCINQLSDVSSVIDDSNPDSSSNQLAHKARLDPNFDRFMTRLLSVSSNTKAISKLSGDAIEHIENRLQGRTFISDFELKHELQNKGVINTPEEWGRVKESLSNLGRLVLVKDDEYCLKPSWIVDTAYALINHESIRKRAGLVSRSELKDLCAGEVKAHRKFNGNVKELSVESDLVIQFLEEQHTTIKLSYSSESQYFFPDAAKTDEAEGLVNLLIEHEQKSELEKASSNDQGDYITGQPLTVEYQFSTLPLGFRARFVLGVSNEETLTFSLPSDVWREGIKLKYKETVIWIDYQLAKQHITLRFFNYNDECQLFKPIGFLYKIIEGLEPSAIPVLTQGFEHLNSNQIAVLFTDVNKFKQVSIVNNIINITDSIIRGDVNQEINNNMKNINNSFNNNKESVVAVGDNVTHSVTGSFNKSINEDQKNIALEALALAKEKLSQDQSNTIDQLISAVNENQAPSSETTLLGRLWHWVKEGKTVVEIGALVVKSLTLL